MRKHRGLAAGLAGGVPQVPDGRLSDAEPLAMRGNADAGIVVNEAVLGDLRQQAGAFLAVGRFRRQARRHPREFFPSRFPELQGAGVAVVEHRIGLGAVRDEDERRGEHSPGKLGGIRHRRQQLPAGEMTQAAGEHLRVPEHGFAEPRIVHETVRLTPPRRRSSAG